MAKFEEPKKFWDKVDVGHPVDCWEWLATKDTYGYGKFYIYGRRWQAHRAAWTLVFGPIPEGLCVLHRCDNPPCCNPSHLFLGTRADNMRDAASKYKAGRQIGDHNLLEEDVEDIRRMYATGRFTQATLAEVFEVSRTTIWNVTAGKTHTKVKNKQP